MILIGSGALDYHISLREQWRKSNDIDFVATYEEIEEYRQKFEYNVKAFYPINGGKSFFMQEKNGWITEFEVAWEGSRAEKLIKFIETQDDNIVLPDGCVVPSLDVLYLLKMSHRYLKNSPHFLKTMEDIHALRKLGAKIRPEHQEYYEQRMKDTYDYKMPNLNVKKDDFFSGDGIDYQWEHDHLHEAVKFMDVPAYTMYAGGEVWSDMEKFKKCSREVQLYGVLEEALVLAYERSQGVFNPRPDPDWSFKFALGKVCSSICGGYFREFAWENYYEVVDLYEKIGKNYVERIDLEIERGNVKRVGQSISV